MTAPLLPPGPQAAPDAAAHLLIVDDDGLIRSLLSRYLGQHGFRVTEAASAAEARRHLAAIAFDLLVIDVQLPGESGLELTRAIRETSAVPILILAARAGAEDRILGLELGADDYLPKPFAPRELLLRISNILKRGALPPVPDLAFVRFGPFTFHIGRGELRRGPQTVRLTERERDLLRIFAARPGETVHRNEIVGDPEGTGERSVDVQVNRLRRKIEADPANPMHLQTVRGIGYRLLVD